MSSKAILRLLPPPNSIALTASCHQVIVTATPSRKRTMSTLTTISEDTPGRASCAKICATSTSRESPTTPNAAVHSFQTLQCVTLWIHEFPPTQSARSATGTLTHASSVCQILTKLPSCQELPNLQSGQHCAHPIHRIWSCRSG